MVKLTFLVEFHEEELHDEITFHAEDDARDDADHTGCKQAKVQESPYGQKLSHVETAAWVASYPI